MNNKSLIGKTVMFLDEEAHRIDPEFYPKPNTLGKITSVDDDEYLVQWEKGTTSDDDEWWALSDHCKIVEDEDQISDEEIFAMLLPKFEKNYPNICWNLSDTMRQAIALVYRSGYTRGQKGRSFVIKQRKQGGNNC